MIKKISIILVIVLGLCVCGYYILIDRNIFQGHDIGADNVLSVNVVLTVDTKAAVEEGLVADIKAEYHVLQYRCTSYKEEMEWFQEYFMKNVGEIEIEDNHVYNCMLLIGDIEDEEAANEILEYIKSMKNVQMVDYIYPYKGKLE